MEIKVLGDGELGSVIAKILNVEALEEDGINKIKNCVIFNCTPANALPSIIKYQPKFIINCCKGVYKGKFPSDYLHNDNNLVSIGGYYKAKHIIDERTPIYVGGNLDPQILDIIKKVFNIKGLSNSSKNMEMAGVLKNVYLLDYSLKFEEIKKEILDHNLLDNQSLQAFTDDYKNCVEHQTRNYLFGKMFYENHNITDSIEKLGLVEGYNALSHIKIDTPLINKIKKLYEKK
jgi:glycerol-3-phosphate dehydrogenase